MFSERCPQPLGLPLEDVVMRRFYDAALYQTRRHYIEGSVSADIVIKTGAMIEKRFGAGVAQYALFAALCDVDDLEAIRSSTFNVGTLDA